LPRPAVAASGGSSGNDASGNSSATGANGGVYRVGWEKTFGFSDSFDPTGGTNADHILAKVGAGELRQRHVHSQGVQERLPARRHALGRREDAAGDPGRREEDRHHLQGAHDQRMTCYENLDKYLMTKVVPWVPYLWSYAQHISAPNVARWEFDQFSGSTAYAHVGVK
jgi:hypothetical protein